MIINLNVRKNTMKYILLACVVSSSLIYSSQEHTLVNEQKATKEVLNDGQSTSELYDSLSAYINIPALRDIIAAYINPWCLLSEFPYASNLNVDWVKPVQGVSLQEQGTAFISGSNRINFQAAIGYELNRHIIVNTQKITSLAAPGNHAYLACGSADNSIHIWCFKNFQFEPLQRIDSHTDTVSAVAFSPCGNYLASGSHDKTMRIWTLTDNKLFACVQIIQAKEAITAVAFDDEYLGLRLSNNLIKLFAIYEKLQKTEAREKERDAIRAKK